MSFGIGLGAFMQGMGQGINLGRSINQMRQENATREAAQGAFRQSQKEREVEIDRVMGSRLPADGEAPVAREQQEPLAVPGAALGLPPMAGPAAPARPRMDMDSMTEDDADFQRRYQQRPAGSNVALPSEAPRRGDAPAAVSNGIAGRAGLDPNSPTYAQDIARINDGVVAQAMPGGVMPRPAGDAAQPAPAPAATAGLPPLPAAREAGGPVSREAAERQVGSAVDFYTRNHAPRVVEQMLANGDTDGARRFQSWIREEQTQRGMRDFGGMMRAAQMGDPQEFGRRFQRLSENDGYNQSGFRVTGTRAIRGDGGTTGMEVTLRGRDGEETTQQFTDMTQLYRLGLSQANPTQMFQHITGELTAARTATTQLAVQDRAERRLEAREGRTENRTIRTENRAAQRTVDTEGRARTEDDRRNARNFRNTLDQQADAAWWRRLEAAARVRGETPEGVRRSLETIRGNLSSSDYNFSRLPAAEQLERAAGIYQQSRETAEGLVQPARPGGAAGGAAPIAPWSRQ